jgi:retron-type reverse transcriptase
MFANMDMIKKLSLSLENNEHTLGVFLDLSKAFDTIDHSILLRKLAYYGIRGTALNWIQSYLSNRKQCVQFNGVISEYKEVICGVPQGSVLGHLLFLLYMNGIPKVCNHLSLILF